MDLQHLNLKFFVLNPAGADLAGIGGVFNGWIQGQVTGDLLIDVADYRHVPAGPGVVLIGHAANYSLDHTDGRLGLLYARKARVDGPPAQRVLDALRAALLACQRLEAETDLRFDTAEVQLVVNDRLLAPNTEATLAALRPTLAAALDSLFAGAAYTLARPTDPRERFGITARAERGAALGELLQRLDQPAREPAAA